jgi:putative transposase
MRKPKAGTDRVQRELEWRDRVARQAAGHQTVRAFCQSESVPVASFYQWRSRLRKRGLAVGAFAAGAQAPAAFIELGAVRGRRLAYDLERADSGVKDGRVEIKLELGGGAVLHVVRG